MLERSSSEKFAANLKWVCSYTGRELKKEVGINEHAKTKRQVLLRRLENGPGYNVSNCYFICSGVSQLEEDVQYYEQELLQDCAEAYDFKLRAFSYHIYASETT